jgi:hypothetical protein
VEVLARTLKMTSGDPLLGGHVEVVARLKRTDLRGPSEGGGGANRGCSQVKTDLRGPFDGVAMGRL